MRLCVKVLQIKCLTIFIDWIYRLLPVFKFAVFSYLLIYNSVPLLHKNIYFILTLLKNVLCYQCVNVMNRSPCLNIHFFDG